MQTNSNYDSEFCGSIPLHLINLVQPYGILLVLNKSDFKILQVSENVESFTGILPSMIVLHSLAEFIPANEFQLIREKFSIEVSGKIPVRVSFNGSKQVQYFLGLMHVKDDYLLLELEPVADDQKEKLFADVFQEVKYSMSAISRSHNTIAVCNAAIKELKRLSGFDRIMLYKFDENWNGEVIAETLEEGMEPYLGLHFPASDIPKQARALYLSNPYRLIPTIDYVPVRIYPLINSVTGSFIDLSNCNLRSVPAVHIEYLKNMGVKASMSTAIIKDEQLWGLISCHHRTEKYLNYEMCSVFELMAGVISSRINVIENREQLAITTRLQQLQAKLMQQVYLEDDLAIALLNYEVDILQLLDCQGAVILFDRKIHTKGIVPKRFDIDDIAMWLHGRQLDKVFAVNDFSSYYENAALYAAIGSGIIVLPIHIEKGEYIIGFRPEVVQHFDWGGNPNEAIRFEKNNITYHPRNSFALWRQEVEQRSLPWEKDRLEIAERFRSFLIEYILKKVYSVM